MFKNEDDKQKIFDKETPTTPILIEDEGFVPGFSSHLCCPRCNNAIANVWSSREYNPNYCHYCGQALKWDF